MGNPICHHEIPADDPVRAMSFYQEIFDWKFNVIDMGESGNYYMFSTGAGSRGGGIYKKSTQAATVVNYVGVADITATCEKIRAIGGQVIMEKTELPDGFGYIAVCRDTEGNMFGLCSDT